MFYSCSAVVRPLVIAAVSVFYCASMGGLPCHAADDARDAASGGELGHDSHAGNRVGDDAHGDSESGATHGGHEDLGHGNASKSLEDATEFKSDLAIYTFVVFLLLLAILGKFAWPPIVEALETRERTIADNIAAAAAKHDEAKEILATHEAKLAGAADEVRELLEEARRDAEHTKGQIVAEARSAARAEHERAMRDLDIATDSAIRKLAESSANLAVDLAGKVVREKITPEHQARVVREALAKFSIVEPSNN